MDRDLRNALRLAVTHCRTLLEDDFRSQLEGAFGVYADGRVGPEASLPQLDAGGIRDRRAIVAAVEHLQSGGLLPADAVAQFVREAAFSTLNRLTALKLMEAPERHLILESVGGGPASRGFRQFTLISPEAIRAEPDGGYRLYLELLFDDLAQEVGVLFDLDVPHGILFPSDRTLRSVVDELIVPELAPIWSEDETLGWVYQYFTPKELRDSARKASSSPRNAYELAFRNQFYTPRYVVEFLVDNTLGREWYEMRHGETRLTEQCQYMVKRKHPIFMASGELEPEPFQDHPRGFGEEDVWTRPNPDIDVEPSLWAYALTVDGYSYAKQHLGVDCGDFANERSARYHETKRWEGTFEELRCCLFFEQRRWHHFGESPQGEDWEALLALNRAICERWNVEVEFVRDRKKRDPRTLRILDPACGSGHFLLYCFDLLETIYEEAWEDDQLAPGLRADFEDRASYVRAIPALILRHNLHGIDIDLRAVQIAQLVLWLRAQRSYARLGIRPAERPPITRVNVIAAEPLPGEREMLREFVNTIEPAPLGDLVLEVWDGMQDVGEIGSLLKAEELVQRAVADAKRDWQSGEVFDQITFFTEQPQPKQQKLDFSFINDEEFWQGAERQVLEQLQRYAQSAPPTDRYRRRLFADDAAQGFALLEMFTEPFDVVLMNPPFGAVSAGAKKYVERAYPRTKNDLYAAFVERGLEVLQPRGMLGAITSRTGFFLTTFRKWREEILLKEAHMTTMADLGYGVLDTAMVETAAYCLEKIDRVGR